MYKHYDVVKEPRIVDGVSYHRNYDEFCQASIKNKENTKSRDFFLLWNNENFF